MSCRSTSEKHVVVAIAETDLQLKDESKEGVAKALDNLRRMFAYHFIELMPAPSVKPFSDLSFTALLRNGHIDETGYITTKGVEDICHILAMAQAMLMGSEEALHNAQAFRQRILYDRIKLVPRNTPAGDRGAHSDERATEPTATGDGHAGMLGM